MKIALNHKQPANENLSNTTNKRRIFYSVECTEYTSEVSENEATVFYLISFSIFGATTAMN